MNTESNPSETYNLSYLRTLADFQKFNVLCDGRIELSDHSVIPVHKAVLALKSIYFRFIFKNEKKQYLFGAKKNFIKIFSSFLSIFST